MRIQTGSVVFGLKLPRPAPEGKPRPLPHQVQYAWPLHVEPGVSGELIHDVARGIAYFDNLDRQRLNLNRYTVHVVPTVSGYLDEMRYKPRTLGCFQPSTRRLVIGQYYRENLWSTRRLRQSHPILTAVEEMAHALDHLYGDVSSSVAYERAFRADMQKLKAKERDKLAFIYELEGSDLDSNRTLRVEVFAAVYAHILTGQHTRSFKIGERFPAVRQFIEQVYLPGRGTVFPVRKPEPPARSKNR